DWSVTGVQTCALPISPLAPPGHSLLPLHRTRAIEANFRTHSARRACLRRGESASYSHFDHRQETRSSRPGGSRSWGLGASLSTRSEERRVGKEGGSRG